MRAGYTPMDEKMAKSLLVFIGLYDMSKHEVNQGESESCESQQSSTFQSQVLPRIKIAGRSRTKKRIPRFHEDAFDQSDSI